MSRELDVKALISHLVRGDGADKCRICMGETSEGQVYLGDTVMMDGERPVTLAELLEVITGVEVLEENELPNGLCSICSDFAVNTAHFSVLCRQANNQWNTTLRLLNDLPLPINLPELTKAIYAILDNDCLTIVNDYKVLDVEEKPLLMPPKSVKLKGNRPNYNILFCQCPICGKEFRHAHELSHHLKKSDDNQRACHICAKIMLRQDLINHLSQDHEVTPFDCKKCPALFHSQTMYLKHLKEAHTSNSACTCGDCGRTFKTKFGYQAHQSLHIPKKCPSCNKQFRNQTCYIYHSKICCNLDASRKGKPESRKRLTFEVRNRMSKKKVKVGMRGSAHNECICDYCGKKFFGRKFVRTHIQHVHMKSTHRPCPYCGKSLAAAHMTEHIKTHELVRQYKCDHCNLVLKTRLGFIQHLRLHTGEKPYACKQCGETFSASSRRSEHMKKVHNYGSELKHSCEMCPARFALPYRLRKHMASVHSLKGDKVVFECNECHEKFSSCRGLIHHGRKHQKDLLQTPKNLKQTNEKGYKDYSV